MTIFLIILCLFLLTYYGNLPAPIFIVLCVAEALALLLWFTPFGYWRLAAF